MNMAIIRAIKAKMIYCCQNKITFDQIGVNNYLFRWVIFEKFSNQLQLDLISRLVNLSYELEHIMAIYDFLQHCSNRLQLYIILISDMIS